MRFLHVNRLSDSIMCAVGICVKVESVWFGGFCFPKLRLQIVAEQKEKSISNDQINQKQKNCSNNLLIDWKLHIQEFNTIQLSSNHLNNTVYFQIAKWTIISLAWCSSFIDLHTTKHICIFIFEKKENLKNRRKDRYSLEFSEQVRVNVCAVSRIHLLLTVKSNQNMNNCF